MNAQTLGSLLAHLDQPGVAEAAVLEAGDLALLAEVREAAGRLELATGEFVLLAVRRFIERADDEAWLQFVGAMGRSDTPGLAALAAILRRAVADVRDLTDTGEAAA